MRPKTVEVANREDVAGYDVDTIIARRLAGEPFGTRNSILPLKEPQRWDTYEANSLGDRNMHYRMVHELGWIPLTIEDLQPGTSPEKIGWQIGEGGILQRGDKGDQKLYKMPKAVRAQIQAAKTAANMRGIGSAKAVKESMVSATGAEHGDEAAGFINDVTVTGRDIVTGGA